MRHVTNCGRVVGITAMEERRNARIQRKRMRTYVTAGTLNRTLKDRIHVERMKKVVRRFERKLRNESVSGYMVEGKSK